MRAAALLALVALLAGCAAGPGPTAGDAAATDSPATTATATDGPPPTPVPDLLGAGVACGEGMWVGFWGVDGGSWAPDEVRTGYSLPANASVSWVAYVDGRVRGVDHAEFDGGGVHADGAGVELNESFAGEHVVRVVAYDDTNGNGEFDAGADRPCLDDGEVVQAGPEVIDFDAATSGERG